MIQGVINWSVKHRLLVGAGTLVLILFGLYSLYETPVDAIPDLGENQVLVSAEWPGRSPQEVEDQITQPLSLNLQGLAGVKTVRASSMFGFSLATIVFEDGVSKAQARESVLERLSVLGDSLPAGVAAKLGPDATGLGWVYQYYLEVEESRTAAGRGYDLGELRSLQDFFIRPQLGAVPGVAEVGSVGGFVRQYQIEVDSQKLRAAGVSLGMVMEAVEQSNLAVGGKTLEENGMEFVVRGVGLLQRAQDLELIALTQKNGSTVYLKDVARVEPGGDFRRGALDFNGHEVVGGTVVMRSGENAREVIARIKTRLQQIAPALPPGVRIKSFYDRGELIDRTLGTLKRALVEELVLVTLAHLIFLAHVRSLLIVLVPLPVSILVSFILMRQFGVTSNLMSLSGLAMAIGVLVDAAIVLTENAIRHCELAEAVKGGPLDAGETVFAVLSASQQVGRPILFATAIIILAFAPVFALTGQEGKLFHPLAFTKTFAMLSAALLALTIVPVLATWLLRGPYRPEHRNPVMRFLLKVYDPALDFALNHPQTILAAAAAVLLGAVTLATRLGHEFMPPLNEGSLLYMPSFAPSASLAEVKRALAAQDRILNGFPEVRSAVGKLGRADTATDPAPVGMIETTIQLKPESEWRPGMTREKLTAEMTAALRRVPGSVPGFIQPIQGRVLMDSTGIRSQLGVKLFGEDAARLPAAALQVQHLIEQVPGATGVSPSRLEAKPWLEARVHREAMAFYGVRTREVLDLVEAGIGGKNVTTVIEGRRRVPVQVRLQRSEREDLTRLAELPVTTAAGKTIPLGQLAEMVRTEGANEITSENGRLLATVQANVAGRDLGGFVAEVKSRLQNELAPALAAQGITLEYGGEYENQLRLQRTLKFIFPSVLLVMFALLRGLYGSAREAAHVLLAVPFALSGGLILQSLLGQPFSAAVWVGYIAAFGTAIQTAVVMVVYLESAVARKRAELGAKFGRADLIAAVKEGARLRLRPKLMTVATIVAGLLPVMWSHGAGSEVMRPIATPVIGGMVSSLAHILIVTPVVFVWLNARSLPDEETDREYARPHPNPRGKGEPLHSV